jgi:carbamoyl-phosphate synthase large subunit
MYNILVTGAGGDIGQSICKILKQWDQTRRLTGCDIHHDHPAKFLCDQFYLVPRCTAATYDSEIEGIVRRESIDLIISASEPELRSFLARGISKVFHNVPLIMANPLSLEVGFDKFLTADFLRQHSLIYPETCEVKNVSKPTFPSIMKSRTGSGSKQIIKLVDQAEFDFFSRKYPDFIIQEYLDDAKGEFTCGLFRSKDGIIRSIIFKRTLSGGFSNYGEVTGDSVTSQLLERLAIALQLEGSINVQLRLTNRGPVIFEINPRFSSTVYFRHLFGFKDLVWAIEDQLGLILSSYQAVQIGRKFYKGYHEYYE